ncbi:hypothetical protein LXL04_008056 [Taraxacum kok-saghyz]
MKIQDFHKSNSYELTNLCVDTFKTHAISGEAVKYKISLDAFNQILKNEGAKSLFKGAGANILRAIAVFLGDVDLHRLCYSCMDKFDYGINQIWKLKEIYCANLTLIAPSLGSSLCELVLCLYLALVAVLHVLDFYTLLGFACHFALYKLGHFCYIGYLLSGCWPVFSCTIRRFRWGDSFRISFCQELLTLVHVVGGYGCSCPYVGGWLFAVRLLPLLRFGFRCACCCLRGYGRCHLFGCFSVTVGFW